MDTIFDFHLVQRYSVRAVWIVFLTVFSLLGCNKNLEDHAIAEAVKLRLSQDPNLKQSEIHVTASQGVITLTGRVSANDQKLEAGHTASQVKGVRQVIVSLDREPVQTAATSIPLVPSGAPMAGKPSTPPSEPAGPISSPLTPASLTTHTWTDPIDRYLASKPSMQRSSPMTGRGQIFEDDGVQYTIDPRLIVAISGAETSFATGKCHKTPVVTTHNAWNWFWCYGSNSCGVDVCGNSSFDTWDSGIKTVSKYVKRNYIVKGLTDVRKIQVKYCTEGCDYWVRNVQTFMQQMGGDPENLVVAQPFPAPLKR